MSLSQASTKAEVKRDIKLQVFLAMNNKYSHTQTDRLIEDVDKVTNNIMGGAIGSTSTDDFVMSKDGYYFRQPAVDMTDPQEFIESVRNKPMPGRCAGTSADQKPHIFIGGRHDGDTRQLTVDSDFKPHKESIGLSVTHNSSSATTVIYWRHHLTVVTGGRSVTRWFYCNEKDISGWTEQRLLSTLDRINKLFINNMEDPMNNI